MRFFPRKMKGFAALAACLLLLHALQAWPGRPSQPGREGRRRHTVTVAADDGTVEQVRYIGIDSLRPTTLAGGWKSWGGGSRSTSRWCWGRGSSLSLTCRGGTATEDPGLPVARRRGKGAMINELMVAEGFALPYSFPPNLRHTELWEAFGRARASGRALVQGPGRVFTPAQVWAELPTVAGHFITVRFKVRRWSHRRPASPYAR